MKASIVAAVAAAGVASAQVVPTPSATYTPPAELVDPALAPFPVVTATTTYTYCPTCVHYTTYVTEYSIFCPTGLAPHQYTITETCTGSAPSFTPHPPGHIPPGFHTTVETCHVCGPTPITATLTCPPGGPTPYIPPGMTTPAPCPGEGCPYAPPGVYPPIPYYPCPGGPNCPPAAPPAYPPPAAPPVYPPVAPPAYPPPAAPPAYPPPAAPPVYPPVAPPAYPPPAAPPVYPPPAAPPVYPPVAPPAPAPAPPVCPGSPNCPVYPPAYSPPKGPAFMPGGNQTFTPYMGAASTNSFQLTGMITSFIGIGIVAALL